uniref:Ionotropic glutamate receptor L-glutamate and glycine-binding domain-containing protein n=1 Tax=Acrobeloides nanus TaxID=290746 RepID=A0A914DXN9_9BILA
MSRFVKLDQLRGKHLKAIVPKLEPPYVNYVNLTSAYEEEVGYGPGIVMEILNEMAMELNLTYTFEFQQDSDWGALVDGNWTGAFGQLVYGDADILAGAAIMEYDRSLVTDLTFPFQFELTGMLIRSPEKFNSYTWLIITEPFSWEVWIFIAASIIISGIMLKIFTHILSHIYPETQYSIFASTWLFYSVFVQQDCCHQ